MGAGCCGGGSDGPAKPVPTMNEQQNDIAKWIRWNVKVKTAPVKGKFGGAQLTLITPLIHQAATNANTFLAKKR